MKGERLELGLGEGVAWVGGGGGGGGGEKKRTCMQFKFNPAAVVIHAGCCFFLPLHSQ